MNPNGDNAGDEARVSLAAANTEVTQQPQGLSPPHEAKPPRSPKALPGRPLDLAAPEPWPERVSDADVLDEVHAALTAHVVLPEGAADAIALWIAYTHAYAGFLFSPRLAITSPDKRCGKTTLLSLLGVLSSRPLLASHITSAALFRAIDRAHPTLLIDEADLYFDKNDDLKAVLNAGHRVGGRVVRTVGENFEARYFDVFAPVAIARIGFLHGTLADRSIEIRMRRRTSDESLERLTPASAAAHHDICRRLARMAADSSDQWHAGDPPLPEGLSDRAADNWRPLLAIAQAAQSHWPERARRACILLSADTANPDDDDRPQTRLLRDLRLALSDFAGDRIASATLVKMLVGEEAAPWSEEGLSVYKLARLLAPFHIRPKTLRFGDGTAKGYEIASFAEAFRRYLDTTQAMKEEP